MLQLDDFYALIVVDRAPTVDTNWPVEIIKKRYQIASEIIKISTSKF